MCVLCYVSHTLFCESFDCVLHIGLRVLAAAIMPLDNALDPNCLVPRIGLKGFSPLLFTKLRSSFLSGQVKTISVSENNSCV